MKFASAKSSKTTKSEGRGLTRDRQRRDRATTPPLRVSFPKIATLKIEFSFSDLGPFTPAPQTTVLHPPAAAYFVYPCPYTDCDGEFNLGPAVSELAAADEQCCDGQMKCNGQRRVDKGTAPCGLTLEYSIEARRT